MSPKRKARFESLFYNWDEHTPEPNVMFLCRLHEGEYFAPCYLYEDGTIFCGESIQIKPEEIECWSELP